jgi:hypothetical protein
MASTSAIVGVTAEVWAAPLPAKARRAAITAAGYFMILTVYRAAAERRMIPVAKKLGGY